jgi:hypothetical protein
MTDPKPKDAQELAKRCADKLGIIVPQIKQELRDEFIQIVSDELSAYIASRDAEVAKLVEDIVKIGMSICKPISMTDAESMLARIEKKCDQALAAHEGTKGDV